MSSSIFHSTNELTLDCIPGDYYTLVLKKGDNNIGRTKTIKQAYDLCISTIKQLDAPMAKCAINDPIAPIPTFEITSNALLKIREYATSHNKPQFEEATRRSLERLASISS